MATARAERVGQFLREHRLALGYGAIMLLAAAVRLWPLDFCASTPWGRPDEELFTQGALRLFSDPNPHTSENGWPELWYRVHHLVQRGLLAYWRWRYGQDLSLGCVFAIAPWRLVMPIRVVAAAMSTATVAMTMRLAWLAGPRTLAPHERHLVAMASGLFYGVNVLAARDGHFAVSDQPLVLFLVAMLVSTVQGVERGWLRDFFLSGLWLGLAIATKWTGLTFGLPPAIALGVRLYRHGAEPRNVAALLLGTLGIAVGFVATNPTFLTLPGPFFEGLSSIALRYDPNAPRAFSMYTDAPIELGISRHLRVSFPFALGWPLTIVAAGGTLAAITRWARRGNVGVFLVGFWTLFFYAGIVGRTTMYFARYSMPAHPTACVGAALAVVLGARWLAERWRPARLATAPHETRVAIFAAVAALALGAEPTFRTIELDRVMARPDARERAVAWMRETIGTEPTDMLGNYSRPQAVGTALAEACEARLPEGFAPHALRLAHTTDGSHLVSDRPGSWYPIANDVTYWSQWHTTPSPTTPYVLAAQPWLPCGTPTQTFQSYVPPASCYRELRRFEPEGVHCDAMWDDQDHFYAPLWGYDRLWTPSSPEAAQWGPVLVVYERTCR
jgi:hypothetical protein